MFRRFITFLLIAGSILGAAQNKGTGPREQSAKEEIRIRKQQKRESREKRKLEKAERKKVKLHHKKLQTKKVQKRMKKSRQTAIRNNDNKREFFMKRWFRKKNKPAQKKD